MQVKRSAWTIQGPLCGTNSEVALRLLRVRSAPRNGRQADAKIKNYAPQKPLIEKSFSAAEVFPRKSFHVAGERSQP
jgi:hypothetical protein